MYGGTKGKQTDEGRARYPLADCGGDNGRAGDRARFCAVRGRCATDFGHVTGLANALVVLAVLLIAGGWMLVGAGTRRFGGRIGGAVFGLLAYLLAGVLWTAGFVLIDPWQVDFRQVDLVRFIVYSVLLWPYALVYTFDWLGLGGI